MVYCFVWQCTTLQYTEDMYVSRWWCQCTSDLVFAAQHWNTTGRTKSCRYTYYIIGGETSKIPSHQVFAASIFVVHSYPVTNSKDTVGSMLDKWRRRKVPRSTHCIWHTSYHVYTFELWLKILVLMGSWTHAKLGDMLSICLCFWPIGNQRRLREVEPAPIGTCLTTNFGPLDNLSLT